MIKSCWTEQFTTFNKFMFAETLEKVDAHPGSAHVPMRILTRILFNILWKLWKLAGKILSKCYDMKKGLKFPLTQGYFPVLVPCLQPLFKSTFLYLNPVHHPCGSGYTRLIFGSSAGSQTLPLFLRFKMKFRWMKCIRFPAGMQRNFHTLHNPPLPEERGWEESQSFVIDGSGEREKREMDSDGLIRYRGEHQILKTHSHWLFCITLSFYYIGPHMAPLLSLEGGRIQLSASWHSQQEVQ